MDVDLAGLHATPDKRSPGGLDVVDDDLQASLRSRQHLGDAGAQHDGTGRAGWRELHKAKRVVDLVVMIGVEADLFHVEGFGAIDVGYRNGDEFELPIHDRISILEEEHQ